MYLRWAKRQGYAGRIVDKCLFKNGGINSAIIEFEFECAYGYLSGEKGVHYMIRGSPNESSQLEVRTFPFILSNCKLIFLSDILCCFHMELYYRKTLFGKNSLLIPYKEY